uniref:STAS domain-containing protein n=1 Tax=Mesocestoides corti TaxID=53468 RepID=A0A5K3FP24_MESCO
VVTFSQLEFQTLRCVSSCYLDCVNFGLLPIRWQAICRQSGAGGLFFSDTFSSTSSTASRSSATTVQSTS